jgi:SAM-dependent methyltransferase
MATDLRTRNNTVKRDLLTQWVPPGSKVLDVGCGQGGDVHKWRTLRVNLTGIDPNPVAIQEAIRRSRGYGTFRTGTIVDAPHELYDVVCYNFSLQYQPIELMTEVTRRLRPGGLFLGVVTDSSRLSSAAEDGISVQYISSRDTISVYIPDTPYYANGPVEEPILEKYALFERLKELGFIHVLWEPFSMYAKFVFRY